MYSRRGRCPDARECAEPVFPPPPDRRRKDRLNALARVGTIGAARGLAGEAEAYLSFYALHASQEKKYKDFPESVID